VKDGRVEHYDRSVSQYKITKITYKNDH